MTPDALVTRADLVPRWSSDMEAAPKDGTPILARTPQAKSRKVRIVAWLGPEANWCVHGWKDTNGTFVEPTHWMPLPAPPKGETE